MTCFTSKMREITWSLVLSQISGQVIFFLWGGGSHHFEFLFLQNGTFFCNVKCLSNFIGYFILFSNSPYQTYDCIGILYDFKVKLNQHIKALFKIE